MYHMKSSRTPGSIVLLASTSGYFGGTGVAAYVASKHGVIGLLRASQQTAQKYGIRVNAVAPFFTPTQITAGFAQKWKEAGLDANTPQGVAGAIANIAVDEKPRGECILVSCSLFPSHLMGRLTSSGRGEVCPADGVHQSAASSRLVGARRDRVHGPSDAVFRGDRWLCLTSMARLNHRSDLTHVLNGADHLSILKCVTSLRQIRR